MSDWERVALRVKSNQLKRWDAVCTPKDPDIPDDEFPNDYPHLYDDRSKLIREAVEELIARETGDLGEPNTEASIDTSHLENDLSLIKKDTTEITDAVEKIQNIQREIRNAATTSDDLTSELYQILPEYDDYTIGVTEITNHTDTKLFEEINSDRASEYGYWRDIAASFNQYSAGEVFDALQKLEDDIQSVKQFRVDGYNFFIDTNE
jgi:hypothetical protein